MARKKTLKSFTAEDLQGELTARFAEQHYRVGMTMSEMELLAWEECGMENPASLRILEALLEQMPFEKPTAKPCPKCGKRAPVKAKDRPRSLRTLAGPLRLLRHYYYCECCHLGFSQRDLALGLPSEGELTAEMEKRVLDFAINDVFGQGAERWNVHYRVPISDNLLRCVARRVGTLCEGAEPSHLQGALKPSADSAAEVLVVQVDGSLLPIRGAEPWKEAKVGVTYRHDTAKGRPVPGSARYTAVIGTVANFAPELEESLIAEDIGDVNAVIWLGDGAPHNWTLADQLAPDATQVLDWYHAVLHATDCGKALLGEESALLALWKQRSEELLMASDVDALVSELMDCIPCLPSRKKDAKEGLEAIEGLVRYYRNNANRMRYRGLREEGLPIGSGAVESAHRHVLQARMKRAGQHWELKSARRMARLRAAYRTGGATRLYGAIQRAHRETRQGLPKRPGVRHGFHFARQGERDRKRASM